MLDGFYKLLNAVMLIIIIQTLLHPDPDLIKGKTILSWVYFFLMVACVVFSATEIMEEEDENEEVENDIR